MLAWHKLYIHLRSQLNTMVCLPRSAQIRSILFSIPENSMVNFHHNPQIGYIQPQKAPEMDGVLRLITTSSR